VDRWAVAPAAKEVAAYFERAPLPVRVTAKELDALVHAVLPNVVAGIKWSVPFYALKGPVCYISVARTHVTFGLLQGVDVSDASGRLIGTGKSPIRKAIFSAGEPVPRATVRAWLRDARRLDASWGTP
jgi:hypothetical protein